MSTADARDILEAALWRSGITAAQVDAILTAADLYAASAAADEAAPGRRLYAALVASGQVEHGTTGGYRRHKAFGQDPCEECAEHMRERWRAKYYVKRARKLGAA